MAALLSYISGSLEELRHVRWPTQQQAVRLSVIVIVFIAITSLAFGIVDALLTGGLRLVVHPDVPVTTQ